MISRDYCTRMMLKARPDLNGEHAQRLIDDAVRLLSNLIHYKNGGSHGDDDVVTAALMIGQDKQ